MEKIDLRAYRNAHRWRVQETEESVFLIDVALPDPNTEDMKWLVEHFDHLYGRIRSAMKMEKKSIKDRERKARVNIWIYSPEVLRTAGLVRKDTPHMFYGTANAAGLQLVTFNMAWNDPQVLDHVTHEVIHHVWCEEVGEAPSLLNEGIATYFECVLSADAAVGRARLKSSWQKYAAATAPGFLRRICRNDSFWETREAGNPMYSVGAELVAFLLDNYGMQNLRQIFLRSHFDDDHLDRHIQEVTGEPVDEIEQRITRCTGLV